MCGRVFLEVMNSNDMRFLCFHFLRAPWCQQYTYHQNMTGECIPTCFMSGMLWNSHPLKTVPGAEWCFLMKEPAASAPQPCHGILPDRPMLPLASPDTPGLPALCGGLWGPSLPLQHPATPNKVNQGSTEPTSTLTRLTASCACIILMFLEGLRSESSCVDPR